jgi:GNAT superfamily N-acetyltransferase
MTDPVQRAVATRPPTPDDADALGLVHVRAWQAAYGDVMPREFLAGLSVERRADGWRRWLADPPADCALVIGTLDDEAVGFVMYGRDRDAEPGGDGELWVLNVHPDAWGTGVGAALVTAAHDGLAGDGFRRAVLWVVPGNARARRFYERHGWRADGAYREVDMDGVTVPEVRYARDLP